jgi:hypothetical protein
MKDADQLFKEMAEGDEPNIFQSEYDFDNSGEFFHGKDGYDLGEAVDFHDLDGVQRPDKKNVPRIIGRTAPKAEYYTEGHPGNQRLASIEEKVQKQLAVLTSVMHLDSFGQKHWYYRLKREYTAEAKILKRLEERQAKKDFRKTLKRLSIEGTLEEEENFEKFYEKKNGEEENFKVPAGYKDEREYRFYGRDTGFMKFHKRTKRNMQSEL